MVPFFFIFLPLARPVYFRPRVLSTDKLGHAPNFIFSRGAITPAREGTPKMVPFFSAFYLRGEHCSVNYLRGER